MRRGLWGFEIANTPTSTSSRAISIWVGKTAGAELGGLGLLLYLRVALEVCLLRDCGEGGNLVSRDLNVNFQGPWSRNPVTIL